MGGTIMAVRGVQPRRTSIQRERKRDWEISWLEEICSPLLIFWHDTYSTAKKKYVLPYLFFIIIKK